MDEKMRILITGSNGFIGKNLMLKLSELKKYDVCEFVRDDSFDLLNELISKADVIIHLAGENRPKCIEAFETVNVNLTQSICELIRKSNKKIPIILASSIQADRDNPYGRSKLEAERVVQKFASETGNPAYIYRLPNVFGKWCKPNYNSVVATYCYNIAHNLPITINDATITLKLVYIDDVVDEFIRVIGLEPKGISRPVVEPEYTITLGDLAEQIQAFRSSRESLVSEPVGVGLVRALYSTYVSYFNADQFSYSLPSYEDDRGIFVEMLKTKDSGQFSFFTSLPGVTRGEHYHHSKTEKFLVIKGSAHFRFRHLITNDTHEIYTTGSKPQVVESIPGWAHDITNVGEDEMIVMLWANEIFCRVRPDTIACKV